MTNRGTVVLNYAKTHNSGGETNHLTSTAGTIVNEPSGEIRTQRSGSYTALQHINGELNNQGTVRFTSHPDGRVSGLRAEMQPSSPGVIRCMREKLATGPVFGGGARTVIYHFSGGRSPDGVQYREGIEFKVEVKSGQPGGSPDKG